MRFIPQLIVALAGIYVIVGFALLLADAAAITRPGLDGPWFLHWYSWVHRPHGA